MVKINSFDVSYGSMWQNFGYKRYLNSLSLKKNFLRNFILAKFCSHFAKIILRLSHNFFY